MSSKHNGVNWNKSSKAKERRRSTIKRLETQLESGRKTLPTANLKAGPVTGELTEKDINRINKELEVLKTRI